MPYVRTTLRGLLVASLALGLTGFVGAAGAQAAPSASEVQKKIDKASDDLEDVVESYNKIRDDLKKTKAAEKALAASLQPAREQLKVASAQVAQIAASAYRSGQVSEINVLLDGPGSLVDRLGMLDQLSQSRADQIAAYTATTEQYSEKQTALHNTQVKQTAQAKELATRKAKIEGDLKKLYAMRTAAYGTPTEKASKYTGDVPSIAGSAGKAVSFAYGALGIMYSYGAEGPDGYDCSGLTMKAWEAAGQSLPHNAAAQYSATTRISRDELRPGDLVFYRSLGHVALYVGDGQIIDASRAGQPVKKRTIDIMTPYAYGRV